MIIKNSMLSMLLLTLFQPMRTLLLLLITFHVAFANAELAKLEIGSSVKAVGYPSEFFLSPYDPNLKEDKNGYSPKVPSELITGDIGNYVREDTSEIIWDFGDGSSSKNTGERIGAKHVYKTPGEYTVKVKVVGGNKQVLNEASINISVKPGVLRPTYSALPITNSEPTRLSFSAATFQRELGEDEKVTYVWDFGDGNTREGESLDQVNHTYAIPGEYKTKLTVTNNYGTQDSKTKTVSIVGANSTEISKTEDVLTPPDVIVNQFNLEVSGDVSGQLNATPIQVANSVFLSRLKNDNCRLWVGFWDDAQLMHGMLLLDLGVLQGELTNYEFTGPQRLDLGFASNAKDYLAWKKSVNPLVSTPNVGSAMHNYSKRVGFRMSSGTIKFTLKNGDYLVGTLSAGLSGQIKTEDFEKELLIGASGDFTLDLSKHGMAGVFNLPENLHDTLMQGHACIEQDFFETERYPLAGQKHVAQDRPIIRVNFNQDIKPDSVNYESFQVGYPDAKNNFVEVAGKFVNDKAKIQFVPDQALRKGVRYTIKLKVGEEGVLSANGSFIQDQNGSGWQESVFWTQLPFSDDENSPSNLSCDVYQSVKNVPLILGKPALFKIYADWPKYDDVHLSAQYGEFDAMLKMGDSVTKPLGDQAHKFTRPDLREGWGKEKLRNEEAAQVPFIPQIAYPNILGHLLVNNYDGSEGKTEYYFNCSTPPWDLAPELKVDVFALNYGRYGYNESTKEHTEISQDQTLELLKGFIKESKDFAEQLYPVKTINFSEPKFIDVPEVQAIDEIDCGISCDIEPADLGFVELISTESEELDRCGDKIIFTNIREKTKAKFANRRRTKLRELWMNELDSLQKISDAHIIVLLGSHELIGGGGHTRLRLTSEQGLLFMSVGEAKANYEKYVYGLVHEIGHVLTLDHTPNVDYCAREKFVLSSDSDVTQFYEGLDGIKLSTDGTSWWHKSSRLGNEESKHIMPLQYPSTRIPNETFILRHEYRSIQKLFETRGDEFKRP